MSTNATSFMVDDSSTDVKYTCSDGGVWMAYAGNQSYAEGTLHYTASSDCSLTYFFSGVGIAVLGERDTSRGLFSVSLDNGPRFWVNANAAHLESRWTLASIHGLQNTTHTLLLQAGPLSDFTTAVDTLVVATSGGFENLGVATKEGEWTSPYAYNPAYIPSALLNNANTPSSSDSNASELKTSASAISGGAGVGIGIAAVLGVELLALLIWVLFRRKTRGSSIHSRTTKTSTTSFGNLPPVNTNVSMTQQGPASGGSPKSTGPLSWRHRQSLPSPATVLEPPSSFSTRQAVAEI